MSESNAATTATPADEPEWMRVRREIGGDYLDPVDEATARDVDYLIARLTNAVNRPQPAAAVERLCAELAVFGRAGDAAFAELRAAYPQLHWTRTNGKFMASPYPPSESDAVEKCADALGLIEVNRTGDGCRDWRGNYADLPVRVIGARR